MFKKTFSDVVERVTRPLVTVLFVMAGLSVLTAALSTAAAIVITKRRKQKAIEE